jgi:radical SAM superfamily enzyme YgiQ (UPF0313 family)
VQGLFKAVTSVKGVENIQVTHANLAAVRADKELAGNVAQLLVEKSDYKLGGKHIAAVEVGIETGSPELFKKHMAGKCRPFKPEEWPDVVLSSLSFLEQYDWIAMATVIIGLPEETDEDVKHTANLLEDIDNNGLRTFLVPLIFVPLGTCSLREIALKTFSDLSESQVDVFARAWEHNIKVWGPDFFGSPPYTSYWAKSVFKLTTSLLYNFKYKRGDKWRRQIADRVVNSLKQVM